MLARVLFFLKAAGDLLWVEGCCNELHIIDVVAVYVTWIYTVMRICLEVVKSVRMARPSIRPWQRRVGDSL